MARQQESEGAGVTGRRAAIAAAAIEVLAAKGSRGLTHRAVDSAAGLKFGSVNYHAPTRARLVRLALEEVFEQDLAVATRHFAHLVDGTEVGPSDVVSSVVGFVREMTTTPARVRVVARHVLLGEAQADNDFRAVFDVQRGAFVDFTAGVLATVGSENSGPTAEMIVMMIEGVMQRQVLIGSASLDDSLESVFERFFGVHPE